MTRIVLRKEWGAKYGQGDDVSANLPWGEVIAHTEAGAIRKEDWAKLGGGLDIASTSEKAHMRAIENYHVTARGWQGIGYSFVIAPDGTIFEGRGWGRRGAHTENRNSTAAGVCLMGHGDLQPATEAFRWLIGEGISLKKIKSDPRIGSHHEYSLKGKSCCGLMIRPHLGRLRGVTAPQPAPKAPAAPRPPFGSGVTAPAGVPLLKRGSTGVRVEELQVAGDGSFGPAVETAVENLQRFFKLKYIDGIYGSSSQWVLQIACNERR
jgi:N-acetylmuramoyl-L-alanine amidase